MNHNLSEIITALQHLRGDKISIEGSPSFATSALIKDTLNQQNDSTSADVSFLTSILETVKGNLWWEQDDTLKHIEKLDNLALKWAENQGFLSNTPTTKTVTSRSILGSPRMPGAFLPNLNKEAGTIFLATNPDSSISIPQKLSKAFGPQNELTRLMVLFHEAAHSEFDCMSTVFSPSSSIQSDIDDPQLIKSLNVGLKGMGDAGKVLNEMFADTYGAMMLLEGTEHSERAVSVVEEMLKTRQATYAQNEYYQEVPAVVQFLLKTKLPFNTYYEAQRDAADIASAIEKELTTRTGFDCTDMVVWSVEEIAPSEKDIKQKRSIQYSQEIELEFNSPVSEDQKKLLQEEFELLLKKMFDLYDVLGRQTGKKLYEAGLDNVSFNLKKFFPHWTADCLKQVLSSHDQWKGKPANELRDIAREIASNSWLSWAHPDRLVQVWYKKQFVDMVAQNNASLLHFKNTGQLFVLFVKLIEGKSVDQEMDAYKDILDHRVFKKLTQYVNFIKDELKHRNDFVTNTENDASTIPEAFWEKGKLAFNARRIEKELYKKNPKIKVLEKVLLGAFEKHTVNTRETLHEILEDVSLNSVMNPQFDWNTEVSTNKALKM